MPNPAEHLRIAGGAPVEGITEPAASTPGDVSAAQRQQRVAQWMIPVFTGALLVVSSLAGEQQKPGSVRRGGCSCAPVPPHPVRLTRRRAAV
jgi:hypothetical protein